MSYSHYSVIRRGKEVARIHDVNYYTQEIIPPRLTFYDAQGSVLKIVAAEVGDVVRPVVVGFYNPFPPIDQSESRIRELRTALSRLQQEHAW
jgi:hypothetical protein